MVVSYPDSNFTVRINEQLLFHKFSLSAIAFWSPSLESCHEFSNVFLQNVFVLILPFASFRLAFTRNHVLKRLKVEVLTVKLSGL